MLNRSALACGAAALVIAAAPAGSGARTIAGSAAVCGSGGGKLVLADADVRIVRVRRRSSGGASYRRLYACAAGGRKAFPLDDPDPEREGDRAVRVALAGRFAAVATVDASSDGTEQRARVRVLDTRSGRRTDHDAVAPHADPADETVTALVVTRAGAGAWIAVNRAPSASNTGVREVWLTRRGRRPSRVEADRTVRPHSLALSADGSTAYWTDAAGPRSSPLDR